MKATVDDVSLARIGIEQIDVGELSAGPLSIGSLVLDTTSLDVSTGTASLRNLRVTISLTMTLVWEVSISIPFDGSLSWSGTIDLGTQSITVPFGDVSLPGLQSLSLDLPSLTVDNLSAVVEAIRDLQLGSLVAQDIRAQGILVPVPDFQIIGLGLTGANIEGLSAPGASSVNATVGSVQGMTVPLGTVTIPNIDLPQASLGDIVGQALDVKATSNPIAFVADAGVLKITLNLTPTARMHTDELRVQGIRASASIGQVQLTNVVLPFTITNLTLSQIGIDTIQIPKIEVG